MVILYVKMMIIHAYDKWYQLQCIVGGNCFSWTLTWIYSLSETLKAKFVFSHFNEKNEIIQIILKISYTV